MSLAAESQVTAAAALGRRGAIPGRCYPRTPRLATASAWACAQPVEQGLIWESQHHSQAYVILPAAPGTCQGRRLSVGKRMEIGRMIMQADTECLLCTRRAFWVAHWQKIPLPSRRLRLDPWVGKIPWRRKWQPTPVFLPGKPHGRRSQLTKVHRITKEMDTTE